MSVRRWCATSLHRASIPGEAALLEIQRLAAIHRDGKHHDGNLAGDDDDEQRQQAIKEHAWRIRECGRDRDRVAAEQIHASVLRSGLGGDRYLANLLVEAYGRCGGVEASRTAFDSIVSPNVYSWTLLIAAYARNGHTGDALSALKRMDLDGVELDAFAYATVLNVLSGKKMLDQARRLHERVTNSPSLELERNLFLGTAIVNMYGRCGSVADAEEMFFRMEQRDVVSWNAMLSAYTRNGHELQALRIFLEMELEGIKADRVVFVTLLETLSKLGDLERGKVVHCRIIEQEFEAEDVLGHALVNHYGKCGALELARSLFGKMVSRNVVSWNVLITSYLQSGLVDDALKIFTEMALDGTKPDEVTFNNLINSCTGVVSLQQARVLHQRLIESGIHVDAVMRNAVMNLYVKSGSLDDARAEFHQMEIKDVVSWTLMLSTYSQSGFVDEAFDLFHQMDLEGLQADAVTYIAVLDACDSSELLDQGRAVHARAAQSEFHQDVAVNTSLVNMYGKCGSLAEAKSLFDRMSYRNELSWNAMVRVFGISGQSSQAFRVHQTMQLEGMKPDTTTLLLLLDACRDLSTGRVLHSKIREAGLESDRGVAHTLVIMYGRHGSLEESNEVFSRSSPDCGKDLASLWNALIAAHTYNGQIDPAWKLLQSMDHQGVRLNKFSYVALLDACSNLQQVEQLHLRLLAEGLEADQEIGNALIALYGQCRDLDSARSVFAAMECTNVVSWTSSIVAHATNGQARQALELLHRMHLEGIHPNKVTLLGLIDACVSLAAAVDSDERSIIIPAYVLSVASRFESTLVLQTALLNMHGKCGNVDEAERIFFGKIPDDERDSIAWNAMVSAYATNGFNPETIDLVRGMDLEGIKLHRVTFLGLLDAAAGIGDLNIVKQVHARVVEAGFLPSLALENSLIAAYGRCGSVEDAKTVFDSIALTRDSVSWSAMIVALSQNWQAAPALELLKSMDLEGVKAGKIAFLRMIESCALIGALAHGRQLHRRIASSGFQTEEVLANALMAMYGKCGCLDSARELFDGEIETIDGDGRTRKNNVVTWTTMVTIYAAAGQHREALELFYDMVLQGVLPTPVTLTSILSGCSHAGLVAQGMHFFECIVEDHCVNPSPDHFNCLVDLMGRSGSLEQAEDLIRKMPGEDHLSWKVLLGACRLHGDLERATNAAVKASTLLDQWDSSPYVLLSNMYLEETVE